MKTPHGSPSFRVLGGLLGFWLLGVGPAFGQAAGTETAASRPAGTYFDAAMAEAARLYEDLESEQALAAVTRARRLARTDAERSAAAIYEGVILADMGRREEALASFRAGLLLAPEARLPAKVSPKVEGDFESVRSAVRQEHAAAAKPADAPVVEAPKALSPAQVAAAPAPGVDLKADVRERGMRRVPTVSWVLLGTGVVAGGVGSLIGLQSRGNVSSARDADLSSDVSGHLDDARGQAVVANVLFGTAAAAAVGAITTYFLSGESPAAAGTP
ncbi:MULTISPECIES: tetratricopeptide repeat protein [unclassified Corallococcus]|uniref:tetratricopeptide repeat protein n=1 Tax=unclassified Corallococcus TaxID=2685029 RepID=UPI001A8E846F|nr:MULTISPECIES: tetratricopeptide repeat protein [unclassified Corallococcus]MBN9683864.1 tetratricopeptide repeat protein [Corallococcus sp. NCSPR001]WAS84636.1 tetratricopeptide repeat protein [Corallococcus sp. NCRR]